MAMSVTTVSPSSRLVRWAHDASGDQPPVVSPGVMRRGAISNPIQPWRHSRRRPGGTRRPVDTHRFDRRRGPVARHERTGVVDARDSNATGSPSLQDRMRPARRGNGLLHPGARDDRLRVLFHGAEYRGRGRQTRPLHWRRLTRCGELRTGLGRRLGEPQAPSTPGSATVALSPPPSRFSSRMSPP